MFILNAKKNIVNRELILKLLLLNMESSENIEQVIAKEDDEQ